MMSDMPRRSDSKDRMIAAARRLFREHGYQGTALSDVVTESAAPRGSVYFHFPGGKEELATEVALVHTADAIAHINRAAGTTSTAAQLIEACLTEKHIPHAHATQLATNAVTSMEGAFSTSRALRSPEPFITNNADIT